MCTVIIEIPQQTSGSVRLLAVRDEMTDRPWDPPGKWWPEEFAGVTGVRDRRAGGAWLAASENALSVILNRPESVAETLSEGDAPLGSRGQIVLDSVTGKQLPERPYTESFNLVEVTPLGATVTYWNGKQLDKAPLGPGVHMIAHGAVDDMNFARIEKWLPAFECLAGMPETEWKEAWIAALERSAELGPDDDRAIIRDNTVHGYPTKSLLVALAEVGGGHDVRLWSAVLDEAARWSGEAFVAAE